MPKYMYRTVLTQDGVRGVLKEGGTSRRAAVEKAVRSVGGKLEAFYFAFGQDDAFVIADFPDNVSAAAMSLVASASGALRVGTTVLITPEEMDEAAKKRVAFRPPGG